MSRKVILKEDKIQVQLEGLNGVMALKSSLAIPYEDIRSVSREIPQAVKGSFKWEGVHLGKRREGTFKSSGNFVFLSYEDPSSVIVLEMEGFAAKGFVFEYNYDYIVLEVENPEDMQARIEQKINK